MSALVPMLAVVGSLFGGDHVDEMAELMDGCLLHPGDGPQLILHRGAKSAADDLFRFEEPDQLITWAAPDRGVVTFKDADDLSAKSAALPDILRRWVACTTR